MKRRAWLIGLTAFVFVGFAWIMGTSIGIAQTPPPLPPIEVDQSNPLLLDTGTPKEEEKEPTPFDPWGPPKPPGANNSSCLVCHKNFEKEEMAKTHQEANVGCAKCHGKSDEHRADEDNITPPDKMYSGLAVRKMCTSECHDEHDVAAHKVVARWLERCPEKKDTENLICTDCHGYHHLRFRTVRWNTETGELITKPSDDEPAEDAGDSETAEGTMQ